MGKIIKAGFMAVWVFIVGTILFSVFSSVLAGDESLAEWVSGHLYLVAFAACYIFLRVGDSLRKRF